jgi:Predicted nucleic acid-binding protein, contains PIN domain
MDAFIAATAKQHQLALVTRNIPDFEATGMRLFNAPYAGASVPLRRRHEPVRSAPGHCGV